MNIIIIEYGGIFAVVVVEILNSRYPKKFNYWFGLAWFQQYKHRNPLTHTHNESDYERLKIRRKKQ